MDVRYIKQSAIARRNQSVFHSSFSMTLSRNFINLPIVLFATIFFDFAITVIPKQLRKLHEENETSLAPSKSHQVISVKHRLSIYTLPKVSVMKRRKNLISMVQTPALSACKVWEYSPRKNHTVLVITQVPALGSHIQFLFCFPTPFPSAHATVLHLLSPSPT